MEAAAKQVDGMAITGVTLYDNGYAVFQREVMVQGHGSINLYFTPEQMTSVLESLQFLGDVGKKVGNIAYEATKPEANIALSSRQPLVGLLRSLVGRQISVKVCTSLHESGFETHQGRILGVDDKLYESDSKVQMEHVSLLLEGGVMRTMPVKAIHSFHIMEAQVQQDLAFSLDLEQNRSNVEVQKLSVFFSDVETPQKLIARYGFSVNEWKSSYRMRLSDHPTQIQLDGLAIVENTLDEDWNEVGLTLVVGAPTIEKSSPGDDSGAWTLFIKATDGTTFSIKVNPKESVLAVKGKIAKKRKVSMLSFRLIFAGKQVDEGRSLSDYSITNRSTLHMSSIAGAATVGGDQDATQTQFIMAVQDNLSYYPIPMKVNAKRKQKAIVPLLQVSTYMCICVLYAMIWELALSSGHSHFFNVAPIFQCATLKKLEWPGDEANGSHVIMLCNSVHNVVYRVSHTLILVTISAKCWIAIY